MTCTLAWCSLALVRAISVQVSAGVSGYQVATLTHMPKGPLLQDGYPRKRAHSTPALVTAAATSAACRRPSAWRPAASSSCSVAAAQLCACKT